MGDGVEGTRGRGLPAAESHQLDIGGRDIADLSEDLVAEVLASVPRLNLVRGEGSSRGSGHRRSMGQVWI